MIDGFVADSSLWLTSSWLCMAPETLSGEQAPLSRLRRGCGPKVSQVFSPYLLSFRQGVIPFGSLRRSCILSACTKWSCRFLPKIATIDYVSEILYEYFCYDFSSSNVPSKNIMDACLTGRKVLLCHGGFWECGSAIAGTKQGYQITCYWWGLWSFNNLYFRKLLYKRPPLENYWHGHMWQTSSFDNVSTSPLLFPLGKFLMNQCFNGSEGLTKPSLFSGGTHGTREWTLQG